jgi:hypothetical protein
MGTNPENISHECSPSGSQFNEVPLSGAAPGDPFGQDPHTDDFTKHLGYFGRSDEITFYAKGVRGTSIVTVFVVSETLGNVLGEGKGALFLGELACTIPKGGYLDLRGEEESEGSGFFGSGNSCGRSSCISASSTIANNACCRVLHEELSSWYPKTSLHHFVRKTVVADRR